MAVRKRNIQIKFYVTEEEKQLIDEKLSQLPAKRMGAYLRKMAIDGYIINLDTADIKAFTGELAANWGAPAGVPLFRFNTGKRNQNSHTPRAKKPGLACDFYALKGRKRFLFGLLVRFCSDAYFFSSWVSCSRRKKSFRKGK